jgi:hypothetical protein
MKIRKTERKLHHTKKSLMKLIDIAKYDEKSSRNAQVITQYQVIKNSISNIRYI